MVLQEIIPGWLVLQLNDVHEIFSQQKTYSHTITRLDHHMNSVLQTDFESHDSKPIKNEKLLKVQYVRIV